MRRILLIAWLMVPIGVGAYHWGPGQQKMELDDVGGLLTQAKYLGDKGEWAKAVDTYNAALTQLPAERTGDSQRIRLLRAKSQMMAEQLPEAHQELKALVGELQESSADPKLLNEAREALANSQYYMTWLLRLEGESREVWEPEIEAARQQYRLLAEQAQDSGDQTLAKQHSEDLEATIRLARMDLGDLQAAPLPCQCCGCKSGQCKKPGKRPGKNPNQGQNKPQDVRGATSGPPPDRGGS